MFSRPSLLPLWGQDYVALHLIQVVPIMAISHACTQFYYSFTLDHHVQKGAHKIMICLAGLGPLTMWTNPP